jgi:hypothetical protein
MTLIQLHCYRIVAGSNWNYIDWLKKKENVSVKYLTSCAPTESGLKHDLKLIMCFFRSELHRDVL